MHTDATALPAQALPAEALSAEAASLQASTPCLLGEGATWSAARGQLLWTDIQGQRLWALEPLSQRLESWPLPGRLGPDDGVDAAFVPQVYIPLAELFADPRKAFVTGDLSWLPTYQATARYQHLFFSAVKAGVDRTTALAQVHKMKDNNLPPDFSVLLDLCGVKSLDELKKQKAAKAQARTAAKKA